MPTCLNCGANLAPEWKYCIYCGAAVATVSPRRRSGRDATIPPAIPSAIRPETMTDTRKTRLDVPLLIGIVLGLAGTALIVYMAILLFGPK